MSRGFWARNTIALGMAVLLVIATVVLVVNVQAQSRAEQAQEARIAELNAEIQTRQQKAAEQLDADTFSALGITASRLASDSSVISGLLQTAFTWDSGESYDSARSTLQSRYKLKDTDEFLARFLPESNFSASQLGLNSSLSQSNLDIEVLKVSGTTYSYLVMADLVFSVDSPPKADTSGVETVTRSTTRRLLLHADVDSNGQVSGLRGIPASGITLHS